MNVPLRDVPAPIIAAINAFFPGQLLRGHTSPRQQWMRRLIALGALGPERDSCALDLWHCAQRIARQQRGEDELRSLESVQSKAFAESLEFDEALAAYQRGDTSQVKLLARLSNILYYAVQAYVQDYDLPALTALTAHYCERAGIPEPLAWRVAAAKYLDRSARAQKCIASEEAAMQRVFEQFGKLVEIQSKTP